MDKEKLLTYFQDHYLSRQEVLFKLPLSYSIDTFWPELLNRRKAQASILPLYNAAGMPYWYSLTPSMVQASERLCEEAISQQKVFDPYRAEMTSAMTEEMFFTSFVEGAQIPLQAAMDFLQRGTEPESIQEQMIWNNRRAWAEMIGAIYRPLDEPFVKSLAFMLTEEMDGCAVDYRQMDNHPIAAMNAEPYDVPPAYCLQDRMNEYYSFLQQGGIHPLIKASAAQAFLLVTRPFPEGNERLSRMISSAVLLRSGYDFFRDISISSVIARESYRYYKSMCEIIRGENGGDLTYFMDYYLGLLVRALDARNERIRRREQEALARERELALVPLQPEKPPEEEKPARKKKEDPQEKPKAAKSPGNGWPKHERKEGTLMDPVPLRDYLEIIDEMRESKYPGNRAIPDRIHHLVDIGKFSFTVAEYAEETGLHRKDADVECRKLYDKGLLDRHMRNGKIAYSLQVSGIRALIDNPIYIGHMHMGDTLSPKLEHLQIIDDELFEKCLETVKGRSTWLKDKMLVPERTDTGSLLSGLLFCASCGSRLYFNHGHSKRKMADGTIKTYVRDSYRCYKKLSDKNACKGQSSYNADAVNDAVLREVRRFLSLIKNIPEEKLKEKARSKHDNIQTIAFKQAEKDFFEAHKQVSTLEEQAIKALTGENSLDISIVNTMIPKYRKKMEQAQKRMDEAKAQMLEEQEKGKAALREASELASWAESFEAADTEGKHSIIARLVERIEISPKYVITIKFRVSMRQYTGEVA